MEGDDSYVGWSTTGNDIITALGTVQSWTLVDRKFFALSDTEIVEGEFNVDNRGIVIFDTFVYLMEDDGNDKFYLTGEIVLSNEAATLVTEKPTDNLYTFLEAQCDCITINTLFECFSNSLCLVSNFN